MLSFEEGHVQKYIRDAGGLNEIQQAVNALMHYAYPSEPYYESKIRRLAKWGPDPGECNELVLAVFTLTLLHDTLTYQAIVGMIAGRLKAIQDAVDQVKTAAEIIAVISKTGLICVSRRGPGLSIMVTTEFRFRDPIPQIDPHLPLFTPPPRVTKNMDPNLGTQLLGGSVKFHNQHICFDHLNRQNAIALSLNRNFLCMHEEAPTFVIDTIEKKRQWDDFIAGSYQKYISIARRKNKFWLENKYDVRGRTYTLNYYVSPQGSSFKKAIVELAKKEKVNM